MFDSLIIAVLGFASSHKATTAPPANGVAGGIVAHS
jgi:hypothetical protein